jgi:hypothetical protein
MTPQERQLVEELFDRLASIENTQRDADAVKAINDGLARAPNALYPLVQSVLVQDEALKRADARIRELEDELGIGPEQPAQQGSFLDSMRDSLLGKREQQGSVPSVRPGAEERRSAVWNTGGALRRGHDDGPDTYAGPPGGYRSQPHENPGGYQSPPQSGAGGGSFLGTAAAAAAGTIGGALLMQSFRGMFGGTANASPRAMDNPAGGSAGAPWGSAAGSDLSREAGLDDIGRGKGAASSDDAGGSQRTGLLDTAQNAENFDDDVESDFDDDLDISGDSDTA